MDKRIVAWITVFIPLFLVACQPAATTPGETAQVRTPQAETTVSPSPAAGATQVSQTQGVQPSPTTLSTPVSSEIRYPVTASPTPTEATGQPALVSTPSPPTALPSEPTQVQALATIPCNLAAPGNPIDITIPDGTSLRPEQAFSKTWRLKNAGACTWTREYAVVWFSGETFGVPDRLLLSNPVPAGETVDITIDMRAPLHAGSYQGNWKLVEPQGDCFGIGPNGDAPFWVRIQVVEETTPTAVPTFTPTSTPAVSASGLVVLLPNDELDLDTNQVGPSETADVSYIVDGKTSHHLLPTHGALFGETLSAVPDPPACQFASLTTDPLIVDETTPGSYFCYHTGQGLPGWGRLVLLDSTSGTLAFEFLTWSAP